MSPAKSSENWLRICEKCIKMTIFRRSFFYRIPLVATSVRWDHKAFITECSSFFFNLSWLSYLTFTCSKLIIETLEKVCNMFKVSCTSLTSFWYFYCQLWIYFAPFFSVSVVDCAQGKISWVSEQNVFYRDQGRFVGKLYFQKSNDQFRCCGTLKR